VAHDAAERDAALVRDVLARIEQGGYAAAVARTAYLLANRGRPLPLELFETKTDLMREYRELLPDLSPDQMRRIRGEQEIIVNHEPQRAIETLPALLADPSDRARYFTLVERLMADPRLQAAQPSAQQRGRIAQLQLVLGPARARSPVRRAAKATDAKSVARRARRAA
jgi:hypothetical protein